MFLESITLRGFKSFADKSELDFEPGITVIVGPNGSGKSNVVDALTWVLGTHSPKSLRSSQMSDVIFAGAPGRPALGRASVEIRIDNSSGLLPIEFSSVTVSRSMYASGENDYAINGVACRLLDISELLSDTGLGRENHTIVGQGRLDEILNARPEERRVLIEEAAGILKHRRRKERALRKLGQMEEHLERLTDLLRELGRQLRPLDRQAKAATTHADLRRRRDQLRLALILRQYDAVMSRLEAASSKAADAGVHAAAIAQQLQDVRAEEERTQALLAADEPGARQAAETHIRLSTVSERLRGLSGRIEERLSGLRAAVEEPVAGQHPVALRAQAQQAERDVAAITEEVDAAEAVALRRADARSEAEMALQAAQQAVTDSQLRHARERERQLRTEGRIAALQSAVGQAAGEESRLSVQVAGLHDRRKGLVRNIEQAQEEIQQLDAEAPALASRLADAEKRLVRAIDTADDLVTAERDLERQRASLQARADALRATAAQAFEGPTAILEAAANGQLPGVRGPLSSQLRIQAGDEQAVALALGELGDALVVDSDEHALGAIGFARGRAGRLILLAGMTQHASRDADRDAQVASRQGRPMIDSVTAAPEVVAVLTWVFAHVYLVPTLTDAAELARQFRGGWFVTAEGESAGVAGWVGGTLTEPTALVSIAGAEEAERHLNGVEDELVVVHRELLDADRTKQRARDAVDSATVLLQESDGRITAAAERLQRLESELRRCTQELDERTIQVQTVQTVIEEGQDELATLEAASDEANPIDDQPAVGDARIQRLSEAVAAAREAEVQARLELRSVQNRHTEIHRQVQALYTQADDVEQQLAAREERMRARMVAARRCEELVALTRLALGVAESSLAAAHHRRETREAGQAQRRELLGATRADLRRLEVQNEELTRLGHAASLAVQQLETAAESLRLQLTDLAAHGQEPEIILATARAERDAADITDADQVPVLAGGQERDGELVAQQQQLDRQLRALGDVNPLAKLEFERVSERHDFMHTQLEDLRSSREDLLEVVRTVDGRIQEVFVAAFTDVASQFEQIFPRLFPGGEGKLVLTDPTDLLTTGVDVEARPAGKRVKRLSLLSGGERSLTALAMMFAIFAARPSPFYVLDEVEAALDDVNLQRFLDVVTDFRSSSQLILVTHQKRTMEIADLLYGVSMQHGGTSKVISARAADLVPTS